MAGLFTNHWQESGLAHDPAADDDSARGNRQDQLGAQLAKIIRLNLPLGMRIRNFIQRKSGPGDDRCARRESLHAIIVERTYPLEVRIKRVAPREDVTYL